MTYRPRIILRQNCSATTRKCWPVRKRRTNRGGRDRIRDDMATLEGTRKVVGGDMQLMADFNDGVKIRGNFTSTLGTAPRSYWSTYSRKALRPNFHQPQYFRPLLQCSYSVFERSGSRLA